MGVWLLELAALLLGEMLELLGREHAVVLRGHDGEPHRRRHDDEAALLGALLEEVQALLVALLLLGLDRLPFVAELVALERLRQHRLELGDELREVLAEGAAAARRDEERARLVRLLEVVHVADVAGHRLRGGALLEERAQERAAPHARRADHDEVVAVAPHREPEARCLERAVLPDGALERLQALGGLEGEVFQVDAGAELRRGEGARRGHRPAC